MDLQKTRRKELNLIHSYSISNYVSEVDRFSLTDQIRDLVDPNGLEKFFSTRCSNYGIALNWLYEGEV